MKTTDNNYQTGRSTYALLVRSQAEDRRVYEAAIYMVFICSAVFSIWQVAHQPLKLPTAAVTQSTHIVQSAGVTHQYGA